MSGPPASNAPKSEEALRFYIDAGVDETVGHDTVNRFTRTDSTETLPAGASKQAPYTLSPATTGKPIIPTAIASPADVHSASAAAQSANTLEELQASLGSFDGCALKATAKSTVFADGNPEAQLMVIGEAPGSDEDRKGVPFVGVSGKLLDGMLQAIGLTRDNTYITNIIPWRPPGNRNPTPEEVGLCAPFLERHVALINPEVILMVGGLSAKTLLNRSEGITRLRGRWEKVSLPGLDSYIPAMATFHPAYLLRSPHQKRLAWRDLLAVKEKLGGIRGG